MIKYQELLDKFVELTFLLRGYDYNDVNTDAQNLIRLAYRAGSQPFQKITEGVSYIWVNYADTSSNKQVISETRIYSETEVVITKKQLRTIDVHWTFYGQEAQDIAYEFRQRLLSYKAKDFLDTSDIKLITLIPEVILLYEEINNIWWPKIDIIVQYYLVTTFDEIIPILNAVNIELDTEKEKITL